MVGRLHYVAAPGSVSIAALAATSKRRLMMRGRPPDEKTGGRSGPARKRQSNVGLTASRRLADGTREARPTRREARYHLTFFNPRNSTKKMKKMGHCVAVAALLTFTSINGFAQTAGVDCAKPHQPVERAICANGALRALDARAGAYYSMLLEAKPAAESTPYREFRESLLAGEQKWQQETRDACGPQVSCLMGAYQHRVDELRASASEHLALTASAAPARTQKPAGPLIDYKDAIYRIGTQDVTLLGGQHTAPAAPDSAAQDVTRVIEPPEHAGGKLGGRPAVAVFLSEEGGGSGTFYYAAVVFADGRGTTFRIGDRIQPVSIAINGDDLVVSYLDRKPDEPMVVPPTVPRERHFAYMNEQIVERPAAQPAAQ